MACAPLRAQDETQGPRVFFYSPPADQPAAGDVELWVDVESDQEIALVIFRVDGIGAGGNPGIPALRLHVTRDLGLYVWEVLEDAGREFGITPYGTEARSGLFPNGFPG